MKRLYRLMRILSLDVVLGAVASGSLVVWWLGQPMPWVWWVALPLSVWVIYTTDHLLDAYRLRERASTARHRFHYRYFRPLVVAWGLGLGSCLSWIPWLAPLELWVFGLGMGGLVLLHLGLVYLVGDRTSWLFTKELGVGGIYSAGVWGAPLVFAWGQWSVTTLYLFGQFALMALINLLAFSLYERHIDERDGHTSFVRAIGPQQARRLIGGLAVLVVGLGGGAWTTAPATQQGSLLGVQGLFALMLGVLLGVSYYEAWFAWRERYRVWGDLVFWFPGLIWLL